MKKLIYFFFIITFIAPVNAVAVIAPLPVLDSTNMEAALIIPLKESTYKKMPFWQRLLIKKVNKKIQKANDQEQEDKQNPFGIAAFVLAPVGLAIALIAGPIGLILILLSLILGLISLFTFKGRKNKIGVITLIIVSALIVITGIIFLIFLSNFN